MNEVYIAERQFTAESETELSLNPGDRITVSCHDDEGKWSYGNIGSRIGWFPLEYARPLEANGSSRVSSPPPSPIGPPVPLKPTPTRSTSNVQERARMLQGIIGPSSISSNPRDSFPPAQNNYQQQQNIGDHQREPRSPNGYQSSQSNSFQPRQALTPPVNKQQPSSNNYRNSNEDQPPRQYDRRTSVPTMPTFNAMPNTSRPAPPALSQSASFSSTPSQNNSSRPPAPFTFQFCVETLYQYNKQNHEELSFSPREKLDIIEKPSPSDDWWRARNKSGEMGLVPKTYVKERPQQLPVLAERLWYKYKIKREETEEQMRNKSVECYVIRDSEAHPGCFTLSVKGPDRVRHIKITTTSSGYEVGDKKFPSLDAVVDFYRNSPIYIADRGAYQLFLSKPLT